MGLFNKNESNPGVAPEFDISKINNFDLRIFKRHRVMFQGRLFYVDPSNKKQINYEGKSIVICDKEIACLSKFDDETLVVGFEDNIVAYSLDGEFNTTSVNIVIEFASFMIYNLRNGLIACKNKADGGQGTFLLINRIGSQYVVTANLAFYCHDLVRVSDNKFFFCNTNQYYLTEEVDGVYDNFFNTDKSICDIIGIRVTDNYYVCISSKGSELLVFDRKSMNYICEYRISTRNITILGFIALKNDMIVLAYCDKGGDITEIKVLGVKNKEIGIVRAFMNYSNEAYLEYISDSSLLILANSGTYKVEIK